jgi:hypothetical protein
MKASANVRCYVEIAQEPGAEIIAINRIYSVIMAIIGAEVQ